MIPIFLFFYPYFLVIYSRRTFLLTHPRRNLFTFPGTNRPNSHSSTSSAIHKNAQKALLFRPLLPSSLSYWYLFPRLLRHCHVPKNRDRIIDQPTGVASPRIHRQQELFGNPSRAEIGEAEAPRILLCTHNLPMPFTKPSEEASTSSSSCHPQKRNVLPRSIKSRRAIDGPQTYYSSPSTATDGAQTKLSVVHARLSSSSPVDVPSCPRP